MKKLILILTAVAFVLAGSTAASAHGTGKVCHKHGAYTQHCHRGP